MQPPAGKLIKSCGKITNFYDKKEPSGPEVNPKSQTKIRNIAIFKMKALFEAIRHILAKFQDSENKESHDKTAFVNGLSWLFSYRAELDKSELFPANSSAAKVSSKRTV